jgi:hypothetical protein
MVCSTRSLLDLNRFSGVGSGRLINSRVQVKLFGIAWLSLMEIISRSGVSFQKLEFRIIGVKMA